MKPLYHSRFLFACLLELLLLGTTTRARGQCFQPAQAYAAGEGQYQAAVGDFNGDGKPDLVAVNAASDGVSVLLGTGTGTFNAPTSYAVGDDPRSVAVGDFNGDGKADLVTANYDADSVSVLLGTGDGTFGSRQDYAVGDSPESVAVGDFDDDGDLDLVTANRSGDNVSVLLGVGDGTFGPKTDYPVGEVPEATAVGDFDGDGDLDLAVANNGTDNVSVLLGAGDGTFGPKTDYPVGDNPNSVTVGDFDGDGDLDLVTANRSDDSVSVLLGNGNGTFGSRQDYAVGDGPEKAALGDFDGDGDLDLAVANDLADSVSVLLGNGDGTFGSKTDYPVGDSPNSVAVGDFNGDGKPDLVTANFGDDNVSVLLNASGPLGLRLGAGPVCAGQALSLTLTGCPDSGPYAAQLSNAFGSFANPRTLGALLPGTNNFPLPQNQPLGTGYRVRLIGGGGQILATLGPFAITGPSLSGVTPAVGGAPVCRGGQATVSFSLPTGGCPFFEGNGFTAQLSSATGSFSNPTSLGPVTPGQNPVTVPASVAAGSGYRIRIVSSQPATTSASSAPFQVRTCASRLSAEEAELVVAPNPVSGGEIRCRLSGMDSPAFSLTTSVGRGVGVSEKTDGSGEWVLTPRQALAPGVYVLQASEGAQRLTRRVLVVE